MLCLTKQGTEHHLSNKIPNLAGYNASTPMASTGAEHARHLRPMSNKCLRVCTAWASKRQLCDCKAAACALVRQAETFSEQLQYLSRRLQQQYLELQFRQAN